jgi:hypothetical protein
MFWLFYYYSSSNAKRIDQAAGPFFNHTPKDVNPQTLQLLFSGW